MLRPYDKNLLINTLTRLNPIQGLVTPPQTMCRVSPTVECGKSSF
jgi:hypothetical protein